MLIEVENGDQHLYFKLSSNLQNSQIQSAHLWIFLRPTRHTLHRNITLYQVDRQFDFGELDFLQVTGFLYFHFHVKYLGTLKDTGNAYDLRIGFTLKHFALN